MCDVRCTGGARAVHGRCTGGARWRWRWRWQWRAPCQLTVDARAACLRMLLGLEQQHARALSHHETVTRLVERLARRLRRLVARGGQRLPRIVACEAERCHSRLRATSEHYVGVAQLQAAQRLADRRRARRALAHLHTRQPPHHCRTRRPHLSCTGIRVRPTRVPRGGRSRAELAARSVRERVCACAALRCRSWAPWHPDGLPPSIRPCCR
jgi:hypothetical protein